VEGKIENMKDVNEKRHDSLKDFVSKTKDMLEARVGQITQFNETIQSMGEDLKKMKIGTDEFMEKIMS